MKANDNIPVAGGGFEAVSGAHSNVQSPLTPDVVIASRAPTVSSTPFQVSTPGYGQPEAFIKSPEQSSGLLCVQSISHQDFSIDIV